VSPFVSLWRALGDHFRDRRLRQLFGRYATYCGSSPFLAPATLMMIAHVEREGVGIVEGGMYQIAEALARLAAARGAKFVLRRRDPTGHRQAWTHRRGKSCERRGNSSRRDHREL
jgi:1-hydroxycarotenoid 3,4-desaturase